MPAISQLYIYPIKSCAGIALNEARLLPYGLEYDRNWMLVDGTGYFVTQRVLPRMALIRTELGDGALVVQAPGMPPLRTPLDAEQLAHAPRVAATVWRDTVTALDCGDEAARWFSDFLGTPLRLVRFDPAAERIASRAWTGNIVAPTRFADGYPLLVIGEASLDDLNERLDSQGVDSIPMNRFRPNVVITGLEAYEEDYVETLVVAAGADEVSLRIVKPCARCPVPDIDQATGAPDPRWPNEPTDTMSTYRAYRADSRLDGAVTFGQNAVVAAGAGGMLALGQDVDAQLRFED
ncbi:MOSC domain-containing protein [Trinickia fusca]|uniref:MOSC domain-containing protein n=1 Tax=Trinickia fusca TaxID=2419777 RepID=A0A494X5E1_9BURK|nr:MOSC N-terminal beta barrel domain-containing protein [Trinickia fusca]RKP45907.1 MOSC domain-containing protein [Trinickia fusca]